MHTLWTDGTAIPAAGNGERDFEALEFYRVFCALRRRVSITCDGRGKPIRTVTVYGLPSALHSAHTLLPSILPFDRNASIFVAKVRRLCNPAEQPYFYYSCNHLDLPHNLYHIFY